MFSRLWAKFIISQLKKNAIKNESVLRVLTHYLLLSMQKQETVSLEITYTPKEDTDELIISCELRKKRGQDE